MWSDDGWLYLMWRDVVDPLILLNRKLQGKENNLIPARHEERSKVAWLRPQDGDAVEGAFS